MAPRLLALLVLTLSAASASGQVVYGDPVPDAARELAAADGSRLSLDAAAGPNGLVVLFWSNACPWADRYAERAAALVAQYAPAGVGFVLVNSNDPAANERETAAASREQAAQAGLAVPYLADADGQLAAAFGARSTPHAFFFGPQRTLLYDGAIDDSPAVVDRVQTPYLRLAMDQSIAGLPVEVQRTQAFGCTIKPAAR